MSDQPTDDKSMSSSTRARATSGPPEIKIVTPRALQELGLYEPWKPEHQGRLFGQLASDHYARTSTLTREELALLVEAFKDEPLPDSLRAAVIADLCGRRTLKQGRKKTQHTALEQVEIVMLPAAYDMAMEDASEERDRLKCIAVNQPRRARVEKTPTRRDIALDLVRTWLPTLKNTGNDRLKNLISETRGILKNDDEKKSEN